MKKVWNIASWSLGIVLLLVLAAFSSQKHDEVKYQNTDIQIDYNQKHYFVTKGEIDELVRSEYPYLDSILIREINITLLEETLDNHPSIRKAEVYSALDGILRIHVQQKQPLYRVHNSTRDYYIAEKGDTMKLSPNYSAKVPLVTGKLSAKSTHEVYEFFKGIKKDEFFGNFFTGIDVDENGDWTLFPKPGRHKVFLGAPENLDEKLRRLKIFYQSVIDKKNIDSIASLNLTYDKQVICKKY